MRVKPILFNTEMVRAILEGRKTCTRRVIKGCIPKDATFGYTAFTPKGSISCRGIFETEYGEKFFKLPYGSGDILYVRETWMDYAGLTMYKADCDIYRLDSLNFAGFRWIPSIHMPKEAARIWLKVTNVRVERLQEITNDGCIAEGIYPSPCRKCKGTFGCDTCLDDEYDEIDEFSKLWNSTINKTDIDTYGWDANPYVWVVEFERCNKLETEP